MRVLVVDDDVPVRALVRRVLERDRHVVATAADGAEALWQLHHVPFDVLVLDVRMPVMDGLSVVRAIRSSGHQCRVLLLTAGGRVLDRVAGLDAGADDFLDKPFDPAELAARVRALGRRDAAHGGVLRVGDVELDPVRCSVQRAGKPVRLRPKEYQLLELLLRHPGRVFSREEILARLWDFAYEASSNVVEVQVRQLRAKIDRPFGSALIETVRGFGYRLVDEDGRRQRSSMAQQWAG